MVAINSREEKRREEKRREENCSLDRGTVTFFWPDRPKRTVRKETFGRMNARGRCLGWYASQLSLANASRAQVISKRPFLCFAGTAG
jgi:hypothetical protein